jgi:CRISPR-associated protein Csm5
MNFTVNIRTLTPLHISSGSVLLRDYDYVTAGGRTFVLDQDAVLDDVFARTNVVPTQPAGKLISPGELREDSRFVRYTIQNETRLNQIHEQIKDVYGRCYLPGSSLKGALRTVLMAHAIRSSAISPRPETLADDPDPRSADDRWDKAVFGDNPNQDLLRALQVADSQPLPKQPSPLRLLNVRAFSATDTTSIPIAVEAIAHNISFTTTLHIEDWLLQEKQARRLGWDNKTEWLTQLPTLANTRARERLEQERQFAFEHKFEHTTRALDQLLAGLNKLTPSQFFLQLGWGTGWTGMTIVSVLPPETQKHIRVRYKLGKPPRASRQWQVDVTQPFPKSRRLQVARGEGVNAEPGVPLGWVLVEVKAR